VQGYGGAPQDRTTGQGERRILEIPSRRVDYNNVERTFGSLGFGKQLSVSQSDDTNREDRWDSWAYIDGSIRHQRNSHSMF
jgi:hypothetical protein